jgi:hypothetical protein
MWNFEFYVLWLDHLQLSSDLCTTIESLPFFAFAHRPTI